jgi:prepilin-type N-terminal cleavage/methylation domain-containing protein
MRGFTLIEIVVVLAIVCIVCGVAVFASLDLLRLQTFRSERSHLETSLLRARARAMHGLCDKDVCVEGDVISVAWGTSEVFFELYSGRASSTGPSTVDTSGRVSILTVSPEGRIEWTN